MLYRVEYRSIANLLLPLLKTWKIIAAISHNLSDLTNSEDVCLYLHREPIQQLSLTFQRFIQRKE